MPPLLHTHTLGFNFRIIRMLSAENEYFVCMMFVSFKCRRENLEIY